MGEATIPSVDQHQGRKIFDHKNIYTTDLLGCAAVCLRQLSNGVSWPASMIQERHSSDILLDFEIQKHVSKTSAFLKSRGARPVL